METNPSEYEPGIDQNQGVAGTMARNEQHGDTEPEGTQLAGLDPNLATNQAEGTSEEAEAEVATDRMGERKYVNDEGMD